MSPFLKETVGDKVYDLSPTTLRMLGGGRVRKFRTGKNVPASVFFTGLFFELFGCGNLGACGRGAVLRLWAKASFH